MKVGVLKLVKELKELEEVIQKFEEERRRYKRGSSYEIFLAGVVQGIFYALNYPNARVSMGEIESRSKERDKLEGGE